MKYLKYFETEADYNAYIQSEDFITPNVSYTADADSVFYHVVKTETGDYKIFLLEKKNISGLTYNMVDLGLPSGLLWADRNVGASSPEDFGTYFAWGETEGYNMSITYCTTAELCAYMQPLFGDEITLTPDNIDEILSNAGIQGKDITTMGIGFGKNKCFSHDWSDYFDVTFYEYEDGYSEYRFNKYYNPDIYDGTGDGFMVLQSEDDTTTVNMGSEYRMPTKLDFIELKYNCTLTFIDFNDNEYSESAAQSNAIPQYNLKGIKFTGSNGNSIFIPASKSCVDSYFGVKIDNNAGVYITSNDTLLWSSNLDDSLNGTENASGLGFNHLEFFTHLKNRYLGMAVRGVCNKQN